MVPLGVATAIFSSQRNEQLEVARSQAQADVDAELPRVAASLEGLTQDVARAAERGANLEAIASLLGEITSQADLTPLAKTFEGFEGEPFFEPYAKVGPHAFFLGATALYYTEPALLKACTALALLSGRGSTGFVHHTAGALS